MTTQEAGKQLRLATKTVAEYCRDGRFPNATKPGRDWDVPAADVAAYDSNRRPQGRPAKKHTQA